MKKILFGLLSVIMAGLASLASWSFVTDDNIRQGVVVHEWGTFTSVATADGKVQSWFPLAWKSDLPKFVYQARGGKGQFLGNMAGTVRMETPVLYFYGDRPATISVQVSFPKGTITEWYPYAKTKEKSGASPFVLTGPGSVTWDQVELQPGASENFPTEKSPSHYYPARETDATPLEVRAKIRNTKGRDTEIVQREKLLFYRGIGTFDLPLAARIDGDHVRVRSQSKQPIGMVILFESRGGQSGFELAELSKDEILIRRPQLSQNSTLPVAELEDILKARNLYAKEAAAMLKTWRDTWFEDGLRMFYIVPDPDTAAILPLAIEPKPTEITRVLVGRYEILTAGREKLIEELTLKLGDSMPDIRKSAAAELRKHGRFAQPIVTRSLAQIKNDGARAEAAKLAYSD